MVEPVHKPEYLQPEAWTRVHCHCHYHQKLAAPGVHVGVVRTSTQQTVGQRRGVHPRKRGCC